MFDELSDLDFEELVADLLGTDLHLQFYTGARGSDGGVDAFAIASNDRRHVLQCKHYRESSQSQLLRAAQAEAKKLSSLNLQLESYWFVTSKPLTHSRRDLLLSALRVGLTTSLHVLGEADLRALLRRHPDVAARHPKLWISETTHLDRILTAGIEQRTLDLLTNTRLTLSRYVQTEAFQDASAMLQMHHVCVIAGPPGVGKTTLARLLMLRSANEGFNTYELTMDNLSEAWRLLARDERQFFYFDDFLGSTTLEINRRGDSDLLRVMGRITQDPSRRFVLTTREYVLRQARLMSEVLDRGQNETYRFLLTLDSYNRFEKARIFYNHLYFATWLDKPVRRALFRSGSLLKIIDHPNYNPRLIEWMTGWSAHSLNSAELDEFPQFCISVLDNPDQVWAHAFKRGLSVYDRIVLLAMIGSDTEVSLDLLQEAFEQLCTALDVPFAGQSFNDALATLDDSFIQSSQASGKTTLTFINASLPDFIYSYLWTGAVELERVVSCSKSFAAVINLWSAQPETASEPCPDRRNAFVEAFMRTFDNGLGIEPSADKWAANRASGWIRSIATCCYNDPWLATELRDWLRPRAAHWVEWWLESDALSVDDMDTLDSLIVADAVAREQFDIALMTILAEMHSSYYRFSLLASAQHFDLILINELDEATLQVDFRDWAQDVMRDVKWHLADVFELEEVFSWFDVFNVEEPSSSDMMKAREALAPRGSASVDNHKQDVDASDEQLMAMFGRLCD